MYFNNSERRDLASLPQTIEHVICLADCECMRRSLIEYSISKRRISPQSYCRRDVALAATALRSAVDVICNTRGGG